MQVRTRLSTLFLFVSILLGVAALLAAFLFHNTAAVWAILLTWSVVTVGIGSAYLKLNSSIDRRTVTALRILAVAVIGIAFWALGQHLSV